MSAEKSNQRGLSGDSESTVTQPEPSPLAGKGESTGRTASTTSKAGSGMNGGKKPKGNKPIGHNVKDKGQPKPKADGNGGDSNAALCKRIDSLERIVTQMVELEQQRYDPPQHNTAVPAGDQPMDTAPDYFYDDPTGAGFEPDFIDHDRQSSSDFSSTSASAEALPVPAMAAKFMAPKDVGKPIDETIAQTANYLVKNQMEGKTLEDVSAKYPLPDNCQFIDTPKVNPPIWEKPAFAYAVKGFKNSACPKITFKGTERLSSHGLGRYHVRHPAGCTSTFVQCPVRIKLPAQGPY